MRSRKKWRCGFTSDLKKLITEDTGKEDPRMVIQVVFDVANPQTSKVVEAWFEVMTLTLLGHGTKGVAEVLGWEYQEKPDTTRVKYYTGL